MANKFTITIGAIDNATKVVKNINKATSSITHPISNISKSMSSLAKEVRNNPLIAFTENVGKSAIGAAEAVGKMISPLGVLTGAASIAGIGELIESLGKSGIALDYSSKRTGLAIGTLQRYRGAATAAGLSADEMQQSLTGLGSTLQDAQYGRNQTANMLLNRMGVSISRNSAGVVDSEKAFKDIAGYISQITDPNVQAEVADAFGLGSMLPILQKGKAGVQELLDQVHKAGVDNEKAAASSDALGKSWNNLWINAEGAGNSISVSLTPALIKLTNAMSDLFGGHGIENRLKGFGDLLQTSSLTSILGYEVGQIYKAKTNTGNSGQTASGKIIRAPNSLTAINPSNDPLGIRSNNPLNLQPGGKEAIFGSSDAGIEAGARNLLKNYQGLTIDQIANKYTPPNGAGNSLASTNNWAAGLSQGTGIDRNQVPDLNDPATLSKMISSIIKNENNKQPYAQSDIDKIAQKVVVEVHVKGNTQGVTAMATGSNNVHVMPPKIAYPMPSGITS